MVEAFSFLAGLVVGLQTFVDWWAIRALWPKKKEAPPAESSDDGDWMGGFSP